LAWPWPRASYLTGDTTLASAIDGIGELPELLLTE
jgi:hypothetical protein